VRLCQREAENTHAGASYGEFCYMTISGSGEEEGFLNSSPTLDTKFRTGPQSSERRVASRH
jgi:hypothetical protein